MIECCHKHKRLLGQRPRRMTWAPSLSKAGIAEPDHQWLLDIADSQQPAVRQAFLEALAKTRDAVQEEALEDAIARKDVAAAMRALGLGDQQNIQTILDTSMVPSLQRTTLLAGAGAVTETLGAAARMRFDITNPKTADFIHNYNFGLIRQISDDTRAGIRQVIENAFAFGGHPYEQARTIRNSIGLTDRQAAAVANFKRMLESGDRGALTRDLRDARFDRTLDRVLGSDEKLTPEQVTRMVDRYRARMIQMRAQTIARTETMRVSNTAQHMAWSQAADKGLLSRQTTRRFWLVTPDDRLCDFCDDVPDLNAEGVGLDEEFDTPLGPVMFPPLHPNCFPGDTLVSASSGITGYSRRWFDGDLAVIRTASGKNFSVTLNHPILTRRGWIGAGLLKEGDDLIGGALRDGFSLGDAHHDDAPAMIQEIADALGRSGEMATAPVPVSAEHFHGDGKGSKIAIVGSNLLLRRNFYATHLQKLLKFMLTDSSIANAARDSLSHFDLRNVAFGFAAHGGMGRANLMLAGVRGHIAPFGSFGLGSSAFRNSGPRQEIVNSHARDAKLAAQLIGGHAGQVKLDKIIGVGRRPFRGHVYNLETRAGWYVAAGIIAHNCRCITYIAGNNSGAFGGFLNF